MSRARRASHTWLVADDIDQAKEDLVREWSAEARARWVIDTTSPDQSLRRQWIECEHVLDRAKLQAERRALLSVIPPDPRQELAATYRELDVHTQTERDLETGDGIWHRSDVGRAAGWLCDLRADRERCEALLGDSDIGWRERRRLRGEIDRSAHAEQLADTEFERLARPPRARLATQRRGLEDRIGALNRAAADRNDWLEQHPEAKRRLGKLDADLQVRDSPPLERTTYRNLAAELIRTLAVEPPAPSPELDLGLDLGP